MLNPQQQKHLDQITRNCQIITFGLALSVIVFVFTVFVILQNAEEQKPIELPLLTYVGIGSALLALVAGAIAPKIIMSNLRQKLAEGQEWNWNPSSVPMEELGDIGPLAAIFQIRLIVGLAILEGAAFMNVIAYMTEYQTISLGMAAALLFAIFLKFPWRTRIEHWVRDEQKTLDQLRKFQK